MVAPHWRDHGGLMRRKRRNRSQRRPAPQPSPIFDDQAPMSKLVIRYASTGVVALVIVAVVTAYASRHLGTLEAMENANRAATMMGAVVVEPVLDDGILTREPASRQAVDRAVRQHVNRPVPDGDSTNDRTTPVRVKIWNRDGTVLYSDEPRLIGVTFGLDPDEVRAIDGAGPTAALSDLSKPENRYEETAVELVEEYVPIHTPNGTPLLFEGYFKYNGVAEDGRRVWLRFAPLTFGALLILELLQVPIAFSLGRRLRRTQQQRESLLHSAIDATDAERRRIASDLHDSVVQDLAGVTFSLAAAARRTGGNGSETGELKEAADRVRDAVRSLRSLLVEIYPPNLYEEGLDAALYDLMARLEPRGITTSMEINAQAEHFGLQATELMYRAAQEALRNVVAHAEADHVVLSLNEYSDSAVLEVSDDGRGVDSSTLGDEDQHFGLRALAGLAANMGASLGVASTPGKGTTLRLEVPLP
jgi:two-component system NarL family sensor kinase